MARVTSDNEGLLADFTCAVVGLGIIGALSNNGRKKNNYKNTWYSYTKTKNENEKLNIEEDKVLTGEEADEAMTFMCLLYALVFILLSSLFPKVIGFTTMIISLIVFLVNLDFKIYDTEGIAGSLMFFICSVILIKNRLYGVISFAIMFSVYSLVIKIIDAIRDVI